ncbi:MAG: MBL fold metallo-hydrolase [Bacteroidota bacterium]|nr:MBL fold metallo-hydrolase [Bacteroidota bacterium]
MNGAEEKRLSRLVFLGTGTSQGVPIIGCHCAVCDSSDARDRRLRTSVALEGLTTRVVIDTGPDFRTQMLREGFTRLDAIVYTHEHKDHLAGMDDVRPFNYLQNKAMTLHASSRVETALRRDFHYAFEEHRHGGVPNVNIAPVTDEQPFKTGELTWMPIPVTHGKLPIHGFKVDNLAYITDASAISERAMSLLQDLEVLVLNALRPQPHYSHFSLSEALDVAQTLNANRTYLTHLSHLMGPHLEVGQALPEGVRLAHDGLVLERLETGVWQEKLSDWAQNANVL